MRIKELFTIPEGEKVTEKMFGRVLLSSVCSILLCMACLVGTTWAWFSVSVENTGNTIQIGSPKVSISVNGSNLVSDTVLQSGTHRVSITHASEGDDFQRKSTLYVALTVDGTKLAYTILNSENQYCQEIEIQIPDGKQCSLTCQASWFAPADTDLLVGDTICVTVEEPEYPTEGTPESTSGATESVD